MVPPSVERIDKFEVLRRLGRGGMGSVYLARDPDIDRLVAIKLLHQTFDEEDARARFNAEAKSTSALRHSNIVTIFQTGTFLERPFIVMEYVEGDTFADISAGSRTLTLGGALHLLDQLLAGLQYAHAKGVVHRDIKPSNVMVDDEGVVRILDFGIARLGDGGGLTRTGVALGTLNYMAPEQLAGKPVDARADIFAAGLVAYELLSSKPAFPQTFPEIATQIAFHAPPPLAEICPGLDPRLTAIVEQCLEKQPADRYPDCAAIRRDLEAVRQSLGPSGLNATLIAARPVAPVSPAFPVTQILERPTPPVPPTVVAPRPATASAPVEVTRRRLRPVTIAMASLLVGALAIVAWRAISPGEPPGTSAPISTESPASAPPQPAPAVAPDRAVTAQPPVAPAPPPAEPPRAAPATRKSAPAPVRVGGSVKPPKLLKRVSPEYPSMATSARLQGTVVLEATIGTDGKVSAVSVIRSIPLLDTAAADAVRQWEYEPTVLKGVAVPVITRVAVEFKLTTPQPVRVGGSIKQPTKTRHVEPSYPAEAQAAGAQGMVILEATIGVEGKVTDVRVLRSIPLLDQAAINAVQQWEYTPTLLNDTPVPVVVTVTVNFTLIPQAPPESPPAKK